MNKEETVRRGKEAFLEGFFGLLCGVAFGATSPLVSHPFDTVKTKMQAQSEYLSGGMIKTFTRVVRYEGFMGLYKGLLPPLIGSSIFRAVQFAAYNACQTTLNDSVYLRKEIPFTFGLEYRVIISSFVASTARAIVETPLELIKVRLQVGTKWNYGSLFQGFGVTWVRTIGLMTTFFVLCDTADRHFPTLSNAPLIGPFIKGGISATVGWWIVWPFENIKSQIQAGNPGPKKILPRLIWILKNGGVKSLFRGFIPGTWRSLIANGASMLAYQWCQDIRAYCTQK